MSGKLYLVPTPIGNLKDITFRAVEVLKSTGLILAEDTRISRKLLSHYEISTQMEPYHEHNKDEQLLKVLNKLQQTNIALISDAGSPGISDPGYELVNACIKQDIEVVALPGATAFVPALTASGLATDNFVFLGFLGKKTSQREKVLTEWSTVKATLIFYESPYRVAETLRDIQNVLGDRKACVAREISKKFESYYRGSVSQIKEYLEHHQLAGEVVILVEGVSKDQEVWDEAKVKQALQHELDQGQSMSFAAKTVAKISGWKKSVIYELGLQAK